MRITDKKWAIEVLDKFIDLAENASSYSDEIAKQTQLVRKIIKDTGISTELSAESRSGEGAKMLRIYAIEAKSLIENDDEIRSKFPKPSSSW